MTATVLDSRRLPGPNLLMDEPGAILSVQLDDARAAALEAAWRRHARALLDAVGWTASTLGVRRVRGGLDLVLSAPLDALLPATNVNEWAWELAAAEVLGGGGPTLEHAIERSRRAIAARARPDLVALDEAARARGLLCVVDDDALTLGAGEGSRTWSLTEPLPAPADVCWDELFDVPIALVTGTNGKSTTVRLLAAMATSAGRLPGLSSTDWIRIGDEVVERGDWSGPGGARAVIRDRRTQVALLETARGGLLRRGLGVRAADAALVTNVAEDHMGEWGVHDLADLARVKFLVTHVARTVVLNADDAWIVHHAKSTFPAPPGSARGAAPASAHAPARSPALDDGRPLPRATDRGHPITWFSVEGLRADLRAHVERGGHAAVLEHDELLWVDGGARGRERVLVAHVGSVPIALGGTALYNVSNALGAIGVAHALGLPVDAMAAGLQTFGRRPQDNPGRSRLVELGGVRLFVDFAHNPHGQAAINTMIRRMRPARVAVVLGQAGDRDDASVRELVRLTWETEPDLVIVKAMPEVLRGRREGEMTALIERELRAAGAPAHAIVHASDELDAVQRALAWARSGDLLLLFTHARRRDVTALVDRLVADGWTPGATTAG